MAKRYHVNFLSLTSVILAYFLSVSLSANPLAEGSSIFDLMSYGKVLDITIEIDLDSIKTRRRSQDAFETSLSFRDRKKNIQKWEVEVTIRGKFRRVHCETPPLKLNFKKSHLREAGLTPFDDYKLVTHCMVDQHLSKELLLKEYLAYKIYNQITDYSYRTHLLKITYKNPETGKEDRQWGFIIEDTALLRTRVEAEKEEGLLFPIDTFDQKQLKVMAVFQFLIGNLDWSLKSGRNVNYIRKEKQIIPIAYDFDFAGLVNAPYANPVLDYQFRPVGKKGSFDPLGLDKDLIVILDYYDAKRKSILKTARKLKFLSVESRRILLQYLDNFYSTPFFMAGEVIGIY